MSDKKGINKEIMQKEMQLNIIQSWAFDTGVFST